MPSHGSHGLHAAIRRDINIVILANFGRYQDVHVAADYIPGGVSEYEFRGLVERLDDPAPVGDDKALGHVLDQRPVPCLALLDVLVSLFKFRVGVT